MGELERRHNADRHRPQPIGDAPPSGGGSNARHERVIGLEARAADMLAASEAALNRSLSDDAQDYLRHARQTGGQ